MADMALVRVVSVGVEVEEILRNVKDPRWEKVSVEFCGGTHVRNTGDIKDLVILEESGIAKGIRRVIAVTGEDAHEAQRVADAFNDQLNHLGKTSHGPQKVEAQKLLQAELDKLAISAVRKGQFRKQMEKISREILDAQKKQQKLDTQKAIDAVNSEFSGDPKKNFAVVNVANVGEHPKLVADVLKHVQTKMKDKSVYILVKEQDKVAHGCITSPEATKAGATSQDWAKSVSDVVGGKAGGKGTVVGNGPHVEKIDEAIEKATEYFAGFKL